MQVFCSPLYSHILSFPLVCYGFVHGMYLYDKYIYFYKDKFLSINEQKDKIPMINMLAHKESIDKKNTQFLILLWNFL
jgi:hypothetical protein